MYHWRAGDKKGVGSAPDVHMSYLYRPGRWGAVTPVTPARKALRRDPRPDPALRWRRPTEECRLLEHSARLSPERGRHGRPVTRAPTCERHGPVTRAPTCERDKALSAEQGHQPAEQRYSSSAFCACNRFSASSHTTEAGPSITSASTSSPRWAGRQCKNSAPGSASPIRAAVMR